MGQIELGLFTDPEGHVDRRCQVRLAASVEGLALAVAAIWTGRRRTSVLLAPPATAFAARTSALGRDGSSPTPSCWTAPSASTCC